MTEKIIFENVSLSFGTQEILKNFTCELLPGKVIGIVGRNGAGKSTFLKLAGQLLKPDNGKIISSKNIAAVTPEMKIYDDLTAEENLKFFAKLRGKNLSAENILELGRHVGLDLEKFAKVRAGNFSTGMRQRLKFAILLSVDADIWLLDEPTSNLDAEGREIFFAEIKKACGAGKIILLATNDKFDIEICNEIISVDNLSCAEKS